MLVRSTTCSAMGIAFCCIILAVTITITVYNITSDDSRILHIGCNQKINGSFSPGETVYFNFTSLVQQTVTFTNCGSDYYLSMYLMDSSEQYIQDQSTNECPSSHCYDPVYCTESGSETFTMYALSSGTYTVKLSPYYWWSSGGYVMEVICNSSAHNPVEYQFDIECGETVTGNLNYPNIATLNFTNPSEQEVVFMTCGSNFGYDSYFDEDRRRSLGSNFYIKNSSGTYIQNQSTYHCDGDGCDDLWCDYALNSPNSETFLINTLSPGWYAIEFMPEYNWFGGDGSFVVTVICPHWDRLEIECGETISGNISNNETVYFNFQSEHSQNVTFSECADPFHTDLKLRNSINSNIGNEWRTNQSKNCNVLFMEELVDGFYTLELTSGSDSRTFSVEASCDHRVTAEVQIECGNMINGDIASGQTVLIEFSNTKAQNVLFTNCHNSDVKDGTYQSLFLKNSSGSYVQTQSTNECDGTNCFFAKGYCNNTNAETFVMLNLPKDIYQIELSHYWYSDSNQDFSVQVICDPILCEKYQYDDMSISSNAFMSYQCELHVEDDDLLNYQFCTGDSEIEENEVRQVEAAFALVNDLGLGLQNNILLLSLLFVNVSTAIFIIYGLNQLSLDMKIDAITSIIATTQIILVTALLSFTYFQFGHCVVKSGDFESSAPTIFHLLIALLATIICHFWAHYSCKACCCCCKYVGFLFTLVLPIFYWLLGSHSISEEPDSLFLILYAFFQCLLPVYLCKLIPRCSRFGNVLMFFWIISTPFTFIILMAIGNSQLGAYIPSWFGFCTSFGIMAWLNPLFILSNVYLMFSHFRFLTVFHNCILLVIFFFDFLSISAFFCSAIVNVQYIAHSFLIPIYIFLLFKSVPNLQPLSTSLIGLYLVAFDVYSDLVVVYFFFDGTEYVFGFLQLLFVITGQVVGAMSDAFGEHSGNMSITDKVMASFGFGRIWFTVNWWNERMTTDGENGKYKVLRQKHKIWDLLYESFPTVALQSYAAMTTNVPLQALAASILISAVSVSFSTVLYLGALLRVQQRDDFQETRLGPSGQTISSSTNSTKISSPNRQHRRREPKRMYLPLFVFMVSDFYIRSIPTVMVLARVTDKWFDRNGIRDTVWRLVFGSVVFAAIAIFEILANYKIRKNSHRGFVYILKIFGASIFSSFHTMLCTLNVLKMDPFYAESVIFSKYLVEHGIRCAVAFIFCILSVSLSGIKLLYPFVLSAFFLLCLVINGVTVHWIFRSEFSSAVSRRMQQSQLIDDAKSIELQAIDSIHSQSEQVTRTAVQVKLQRIQRNTMKVEEAGYERAITKDSK